MGRRSTSLATGERQFKTTVRYDFIITEMAKIKVTKNTKCGQGRRTEIVVSPWKIGHLF